MNREINFVLNEFDSIPDTLRENPGVDIPAKSIRVDLARLYHHYYLDSYGKKPPNPDPANFEYIQFLADTDDFRLAGDGIGDSTAKRRNSSNELGQAFCRWFLHDHLNITYFAHMDKVLNKKLPPEFSGLGIRRIDKGDAPDYLCADDSKSVYLAEAKGRYSSISFTNSEFSKWRDQFSRVEVTDAMSVAKSIKGFIVGTRFSTEEKSSSLKSCIFAEDPKSPGESNVDEALTSLLYKLVMREHFSEVFQKLNQPLVSAALSTGSRIPAQLQIQATSWRLAIDYLNEMEFVGGYWLSTEGTLPFTVGDEGKIVRNQPDMLRLDQASGVFVGLERKVFEAVCSMVRSSSDSINQHVRPIADIAPFYSAISLLRDGSIIGPSEFFVPVDIVRV